MLPESDQAMTSDDASLLLSIHHAVALLEIHPKGDRILMHLRDETVQPEITAPLKNTEAASLLAFKSVEMLRVLLMMEAANKGGTPPAKETPPPSFPRSSPSLPCFSAPCCNQGSITDLAKCRRRFKLAAASLCTSRPDFDSWQLAYCLP